jgi:hypothetical protein
MRTSLILALSVFTSASPLVAQERSGAVPERRLTTADARFPHTFSSIRGLRELPDGRVMVADGIDEVVLIADLKTGKGDTLGRVGQGPGEYKSPDAIYSLPGGGTLLVDLGNGRLNYLGPDGRYRESAPIAQGNMPRLSIIIPRGVDGQGRVYFQPAMGGPRGGVPDSASVVRWNRAQSAFDTVARVKLPEMKTESSGTANNQRMSQRPRPYPIQDSWNVGPNGQVAIARGREYRVDWITADGRLVRGRPVTVTPVPVRDADKREWVAEQANGLRVNMENRNGQMTMSFGRGGNPDAEEEEAIEATEWPAAKPPFSGVWVSPAGEAWVERSVPAGSPRVMDVFDAAGVLKSRVTLPAGRRLVGFGNGVIYLRHSDESDLQHLERYRL